MEPITRQEAECRCCERMLTVFEPKPEDYTCHGCTNHCPDDGGRCAVRRLIRPPGGGN